MNIEKEKVVTTKILKVAVDKIKTDYPNRTEVAEQIEQAGLGGGVTYATEAEVLELFEDDAAPDEMGEQPAL